MLIGTRRLLEQHAVPLATLAPIVERLLHEGKTLMLVALDGQAAGIIAAADTMRPTAATAIAALKALDIQPVMMTGDNRPPPRRSRAR